MSAEQETPLKAIQVKLVLLGEAAVGKSSLVLRFVSNDFNENNSPTIGAAFLTQKCRLEDKVIKFEIWDTAGQERFHSLAPMYYRNAAAAVVVYDVTKAASLEKAKAWVKELQRQASPNIIIALVGNKLDLVSGDAPGLTDPQAEAEAEAEGDAEDDEDEASTPTAAASANADGETQRQVPTSEAAAYAKESGLLFFEASAKLGTNVQEVFTEIAKTIKVESVLNKNAPAAGATGGSNRRTAGANAAQDGVNLDQGLGAKVRGGCC